MNEPLPVESPSISIIVPVYKAESYLHRCVDSLLAQTMPDFEILLIDDGSPDRSGSICDAYAVKDTRVHVFHKPNEGVSATRQFGLDHARGEYVIHADPDDWVEPDMLAKLLDKAREVDADMVVCDFYYDTTDGSTYKAQTLTSLKPADVLNQLLFLRLHGSLCNKLVRRTCYSRYDVSFPQGLNYCEDYMVCVQLLSHPELRIAYLPAAFYHYDCYSNEGSITRAFTIETYRQRMDFLRRVMPYARANRAVYYTILSRILYDAAVQHRLLSGGELLHRYGLHALTIVWHFYGIRTRFALLLALWGMPDCGRRLLRKSYH